MDDSGDDDVLTNETGVASPDEWSDSPSARQTAMIGAALSGPLQCTACNAHIPGTRRDMAFKHPVLGVLICAKCHTTHTTKQIEQGEDGLDEECRWCAEGGELICCDLCHNAFCKICLKRNLGKDALNAILNSDEEETWSCYVCDSEPISSLVEQCDAVLQALEEFEMMQPLPQKQPSVKKVAQQKTVTPKPIQRPKSEGVRKSKGLSTEKARQIGSIKPKGFGKGFPIGVPPGKSDEDIVLIRTPAGAIVGMQKKKLKEGAGEEESQDDLPQPQIDQNNVWLVLEKLLAATQSMSMLLASLKEDLVRTTGETDQEADADDGFAAFNALSTAAQKKKRDIANKFWRAFVAYKKSFCDIERFSQTSSAAMAVRAQQYSMITMNTGQEDESGGQGDAAEGEGGLKRQAGDEDEGPGAKRVRLDEPQMSVVKVEGGLEGLVGQQLVTSNGCVLVTIGEGGNISAVLRTAENAEGQNIVYEGDMQQVGELTAEQLLATAGEGQEQLTQEQMYQYSSSY